MASMDRAHELFFEVFEALPRQGPGSRASAVRALALCSGLPTTAAVLDLGCGSGGQTLHLAELVQGPIVAVDLHAPNLVRLRDRLQRLGLAGRILPVQADLSRPAQAPEGFDLIWSEGALYNLGIPAALTLYHPLLRPGGYLAFTDAVWRVDEPPEEARKAFEEYPGMGSVRELLRTVGASPFSLVGHFTLPHRDWWDELYGPMELRIEELRQQYRGDLTAQAALEELAREPELHRRHGETYGYEFVVLQKG